MIVFSNTTPFIALAAIVKIELLPKIFKEIYVADAIPSFRDAAEKMKNQGILLPGSANLAACDSFR